MRPPEQVARTAGFAVRVFSAAIIATVLYSIAVSEVRRVLLSDLLIAVGLLGRREKFARPDFALLARAFNRVITGLWATHWDETHRQCGPPHPARSGW